MRTNQQVLSTISNHNVDQFIIIIQRNRLQTVGTNVSKVRYRRLLNTSKARREEQVILAFGSIPTHVDDCLNTLTSFDSKQVNNWNTLS